MGLIDAACNHESFILYPSFLHTLGYFFTCISLFIPRMEISLIFCLCFYLLYRRRNNHFDVHFRRIGPSFFLSKDGKDAVREGRNGRKGVYFPPESASFPLINTTIKVLFPVGTLIWRVNNHVSRQGRV